MNRSSRPVPIILRLFNSLPSTFLNLQIVKSIKDAITAQDNEIMHIILQVEWSDLRLSNDHSILATILLQLRLNISECPRHTQPPRQHSEWSQEHLLSLRPSIQVAWYSNSITGWYSLECLCLVYLASILHYSVLLRILIGSMIPRQYE